MKESIKTTTYDRKSIQEIEQKWRNTWDETNAFKTANPQKGDKTFYCLDMFPYPSGYGLHVGHPVGYIASDIISRYKRMKGFNVLHPMGWDAFGLPTERYAMKTGVHPDITTKKNAENYKRQMKMMGLSYDWDREFSTTDPEYYKWTQFIFLRMYNAWFDEEQQKARPIRELPIPDEIKQQGERAVGAYIDAHRLVYYDESVVNWCPQLNSVVANEEVMADGRTEHGFEVIKKPMRQVMMRITAYADRLIKGLDNLDWPESIKEQQRTWIGRTTGVEVTFQGLSGAIDISVFTTHIETIFGVTFLVIAPELEIVEQITTKEHKESVQQYVEEAIRSGERQRKQQNEKTGVFTGYYVKNPVTGDSVPVYVADYVLKDHGTGAVMGVAAHDQRDFDFAKNFDLAIVPLFAPQDEVLKEKVINKEIPWLEEGYGLELTYAVYQELALEGLSSSKVAKKIGDYILQKGMGREVVHYKMRDWVFARQRYWGDPIPLVHMDDGSVLDVPEAELPLTLPILDDYTPAGEGQSALARAMDWISYTQESTGNKGKRELSTMPQWAGSCWYALRFMDPQNNDWIVDPNIEKAWGPVDLYIGGAEHATLHLLYSRFWYLAMYDLEVIQTEEPYKKLVNQGMLTGFAFKTPRGIIVPIDDVEEKEDGEAYIKTSSEHYAHELHGVPLQKVRAKMSKSLRNVVNPDDVIKAYGADSFRVFLMFMAPIEGGREWETKNIIPTVKFLGRVWAFVTGEKETGVRDVVSKEDEPVETVRALNEAILGIGHDIEFLKYNTAIAKIMIFLNKVTKLQISKESLDKFVCLIAPFAPFMAEELWQRCGYETTLVKAPWPEITEIKAAFKQNIVVPLTLNGKKIATFEIEEGLQEDQVKSMVLEKFGESKWKVAQNDHFVIIHDKKTQQIKLVNIVR